MFYEALCVCIFLGYKFYENYEMPLKESISRDKYCTVWFFLMVLYVPYQYVKEYVVHKNNVIVNKQFNKFCSTLLV